LKERKGMKLLCNAKINLTLGITGVREDGYHIIDSVMQSVNIRDEITVNKSEKITVICSKNEFSGEKNIAFSAAKEFFNFAKINGGVEIVIKKGIPDAAGLGGGSADAAAVIIALNIIYDTKLNINELCEIGLKVGADVPFCIVGGTARVKGIGEILEPLEAVENLWFVIAKNGIKSSTGDMYKKYDSLNTPFIPDTEAIVSAISNKDNKRISENIGNSFEEITGLYGIDKILKDTAPLSVSLSGSGPSVFAVYDKKADAEEALSALKKEKIKAFIATPESKGVIVLQ